jgi:hypothetical protein
VFDNTKRRSPADPDGSFLLDQGSHSSVGSFPCPEKSASSHVATTVDQAALPANVCRPGDSGLAWAELDNLVSKLYRASAAYQSTEDKLNGTADPSAELALKMRQIRNGLRKKMEWKAVMKDDPSRCYRDPYPAEPVYGTVLSAGDGDEISLQCETGDAITSCATLDSPVQGESRVPDLDRVRSCPETLSPRRTSHSEYATVDLCPYFVCFNALCALWIAL